MASINIITSSDQLEELKKTSTLLIIDCMLTPPLIRLSLLCPRVIVLPIWNLSNFADRQFSLAVHAIWCAPCKLVNPIFVKLAEKYASPGKIVFAKCDVDHNQQISKDLDVTV